MYCFKFWMKSASPSEISIDYLKHWGCLQVTSREIWIQPQIWLKTKLLNRSLTAKSTENNRKWVQTSIHVIHEATLLASLSSTLKIAKKTHKIESRFFTPDDWQKKNFIKISKSTSINFVNDKKFITYSLRCAHFRKSHNFMLKFSCCFSCAKHVYKNMNQFWNRNVIFHVFSLLLCRLTFYARILFIS